jgi:Protein of unknown function (DUF3320).
LDELAHRNVETPPRRFPAYQKFKETINTNIEPHEASKEMLANLTLRIVQQEGPIHEMEVARRIADCFGKKRTGGRITDSVSRALRHAKRSNQAELSTDGKFWFTTKQAQSPPIRDRSSETGTLLKPEFIAPIEIEAVLEVVLQDSGGAADEDIVRATINMIGFKRSGPELTSRFTKILHSKTG